MINSLGDALGSVLAVILMIALGFGLSKRGWFKGEAGSLISRLVVSVALPAYMFANLMGGYDRAKLLSMLPGLPIPFAVMLICFALAFGIAALFRITPDRRGTFASMFGLSNTIFIGLPVNIALFGEASLPYVLLSYIATPPSSGPSASTASRGTGPSGTGGRSLPSSPSRASGASSRRPSSPSSSPWPSSSWE